MDPLGKANSEAVAYINGKRFTLPANRADTTLLTYLRGECRAQTA